MKCCIVFGGAGFIGTKLVERLLQNRLFEKIIIADLQACKIQKEGCESVVVDVRKPIDPILFQEDRVEWIFNLAAICQEPGFEKEEYFDTNILGAENVCAFAENIGCHNIFFTSSMALYGPTTRPADEDYLPMPDTPYGISKLAAEYIHQLWASRSNERRLVSVRPAVIYGPGDTGNIPRMIKAVSKGYFILPVSPRLKKSYGYVYGLLDSIEFCMNQKSKVIIYNYAERNTEDLGSMIKIIATHVKNKPIVFRFPLILLRSIAVLLQGFNINGIHPERVKKVARPTHILPSVLEKRGFVFKYDFKLSLENWSPIGFK